MTNVTTVELMKKKFFVLFCFSLPFFMQKPFYSKHRSSEYLSHSGPTLKCSEHTMSVEFPTEKTAAQSALKVDILTCGSMGIDLPLVPLVDI